MALDATRLKNALGPEIENQVRTVLGLGSTPYPDLTNWSNAVATAIATKVVEEITTNAGIVLAANDIKSLPTGNPNEVGNMAVTLTGKIA